MKIIIRKKSKMEWLCVFIFFMPFCFSFVIDFLGLPSLVKYTLDIAWCLLLFSSVYYKHSVSNIYVRDILKVVIIFALLSLGVYLFNYQSVFYYLWGLRNNLRFFVYFFACTLYIRECSTENYLAFFDFLIIPNLLIVLVQYFVLGYSGDYLGGIFGVEKGCNGYMNIFMMIVITKSLLYYMSNKELLLKCVLKLAVVLLIAALAEMKMFIIEVVAIVVLCGLFTKFSPKKLLIILISICGAVLSARIIAILFPVFAEWFSIEKILEMGLSEEGYTSRGDVNRLTAVPLVLKMFLPNIWDKLFGLGLGNCDYASFDFLTTPFYRAYGRLNYTWMLSGFLVLETGLVGLTLYCLFFVRVFTGASKMERETPSRQLQCQMAKVLSLMCFVLIIYNSSLRAEPAYMMYFVLALPFIPEAPKETPSEMIATQEV